MDLNKVLLIGNLVRDPEPRTLPSGNDVVSFSVAANYTWLDAQTKEPQRAVDYHDIVAWGRHADVARRYLQQGMKVYLEGTLRHREYTRKDGTKARKAEIVLRHLIMLTPKAKLASEDIDIPAGETEPSTAAGS